MIIGRQSGLGKGLGALIPPKQNHAVITPPYAASPPVVIEPVEKLSVEPLHEGGMVLVHLAIENIQRNPQQPRLHFDHDEMEELVESIKAHGILQPVIVTRRADGAYELIAGERRLRACTIAGVKMIPAMVRAASEQQKLQFALIENIQRQDLNPIEEGRAFVRLMDEFHLTQDQIGTEMGKSRSQIANTIRLLQLPQEIQQALIDRRMSMSQARALLSLPSDHERLQVFAKMMANHVTVREAEESISDRLGRRRAVRDPNVMGAENELREWFRCKVDIKRKPTGQGEIRFRFFSDEEFQALMQGFGDKGTTAHVS